VEHFEQHLLRLRARAPAIRLADCAGDGSPLCTVVVTIDDGYAETLARALPLLERYEIPATVFVATGHLGSAREFFWDSLERLLLSPGELPDSLTTEVEGRRHTWRFGESRRYELADWDRHRHWRAWESPPTERHAAYRDLWALLGKTSHGARTAALEALFAAAGCDPAPRPSYRLLSPSEAAGLASHALIDLGAHSVTHSVLSALSPEEQQSEIVESRRVLELLARRPVDCFAYPFGQREHFSELTTTLVRGAGFSFACANFPGVVTGAGNRFQIPRLQVGDWSGEEFDRHLDSWLSQRA
jgi:peptidoglycan/xylan/chitin deacetylase (PgdA/CDA1 family)